MLDFRLAVVIIAVAPFFFALSKIFFRRMRKLSRQIRDTESVVQSHIQESLQHKTVVQSMLQGDAVGDRLDRLQSEEMGTVRKRTGFSIFSSSAVSAAFGIGYSTALLSGRFRNLFRHSDIRYLDCLSSACGADTGSVNADCAADFFFCQC